MFLCKTRGIFMRIESGKAYACIAMLIAVFLLSGCGDDGDPVKPVDDAAEFKPLTTPENLIHNLALSYGELNISEYDKLLLSADDGDYGQEYYWFFQADDVTTLGED
jgi:hypothetical protein